MLIELNVQATSESVRIKLPQFDASTMVKNSVAYRDGKDGVRLIVDLGKSAEDLLEETPVHLQAALADLNFVHPFDVEQFRPEFIVEMIRYYAVKLVPDTRMAHWFRLYIIDRLQLSLSIADYERLSLAQRQEFEYGLTKSPPPKIRELTVNGGSSLSLEFVEAKHHLERQCAIADWLLWGLRFFGVVGSLLLLVKVWPNLPLTAEIVWTLILLAAMLGSAVLGDWLALTVWGIIMPRFLPISTLRAVVAQTNIAKIEKTWLGKLLREPKSVNPNS